MATPVAQYIRMSTDNQALSLELQRDEIARYAEAHAMQVVRTYADPGKSGLRLGGRDAMRRLLQDVLDLDCPFDVVLVLDVSRWGRFQDVDESAYYEYHCRSNGVRVIYVAEPFMPEPSPYDAIVKQLKRVSAAEYSKELARKCQSGQAKAVSMGFACGLPPCIGFAREAVSMDGSTTKLSAGQRKPAANDRVRWVHSSDREIALVRRIFAEYVEGMAATEIARRLNAEGERTNRGREFTVGALKGLLRSEIVRGVFRWGAHRGHSGASIVPRISPPPMNDFMISAIVEARVFEAAQARLQKAASMRSAGYARHWMLALLRDALQVNPALRSDQFKAAGLPSPSAYRAHFGSVLTAFTEAGRPGRWTDDWTLRMREAHRVGKRFARDVFNLMVEAGIPCSLDHRRHLISSRGLLLKVRTARALPTIKGERWVAAHAFRDRAPNLWLLVMRMNSDRSTGRDFFLMPPAAHATFSGKLSAQNLETLMVYQIGNAGSLSDALRVVFTLPTLLEACVS